MGTANTHTLTHSNSDTHLHNHPPPPHTHTHDLGKRRGERRDSTGIHSIKLEITTLIENKKMEGKRRKKAVIALHALDIRIDS